MRTTLGLSLAGAVILALLGGLPVGVVAQSEGSEAMAFPTGTFVAKENRGLTVAFNEDGTCRWRHARETWVVPCTYGVNGNLYTEMTFDYPGGVQTPATYYWDFDGEHLTFELWGEDLRPHRQWGYADHTHILVEDPRIVMVAYTDIAAGERLIGGVEQGFAPASDGALTIRDVVGKVAAVPISKGQPITPDMVEPPAE